MSLLPLSSPTPPFSFPNGSSPMGGPTLADQLSSFGMSGASHGNFFNPGGVPANFNQHTQPTTVQIPGMPGGAGPGAGGNGFGDTTFMDKASLALGGLQTIGNLWAAFQAAKVAKQQVRLQKDAFNANLANQIKSYNTGLEDRIRSRSFTEGRDSGYADTYLQKHSLTDQRKR